MKDIDDDIEALVKKQIATKDPPHLTGNYFTPLYSYVRTLYRDILNVSYNRLDFFLRNHDIKPVKPRYQIRFSLVIIVEFIRIDRTIQSKVGDIMKRFGMQNNPVEDRIFIEKTFSDFYLEHKDKINLQFRELFEKHNATIRPFRDSRRSFIAIVIALSTLVLTILINFRNEIWNYFSK